MQHWHQQANITCNHNIDYIRIYFPLHQLRRHGAYCPWSTVWYQGTSLSWCIQQHFFLSAHGLSPARLCVGPSYNAPSLACLNLYAVHVPNEGIKQVLNVYHCPLIKCPLLMPNNQPVLGYGIELCFAEMALHLTNLGTNLQLIFNIIHDLIQ